MTLRLAARRFTGVDRAPASAPWRALHAVEDAAAPALQRVLLGHIASWGAEREHLGLSDTASFFDVETALADARQWEVLRLALERDVLGLLRASVVAGGSATWRVTRAPRIAKAGLRGVFDIANPEVTRWAAQRAAELATNMVAESRLTLRELVRVATERAASLGSTQRDILRALERGIGLDRVRAGALLRYEATLRDGDLSERRVAELVARQRSAYLSDRAHTIARHETMAAAQAGQTQAWAQAVARELLPMRPMTRIVATDDDRTCPICRGPDGFEGVEARLGEPYMNARGETSAGPPFHVKCRCVRVLILEDP